MDLSNPEFFYCSEYRCTLRKSVCASRHEEAIANKAVTEGPYQREDWRWKTDAGIRLEKCADCVTGALHLTERLIMTTTKEPKTQLCEICGERPVRQRLGVPQRTCQECWKAKIKEGQRRAGYKPPMKGRRIEVNMVETPEAVKDSAMERVLRAVRIIEIVRAKPDASLGALLPEVLGELP